MGSSIDDLSVDLQTLIDGVCDQCERQWKAGQRPQIETRLAEVPPGAREPLLRELLLLELTYEQASGYAQAAERWRERFPQYGGVIESLCARLEQQAAVHLTAGQRVGRYVIQRLLGRGGFGEVYLATDALLPRQVAIKLPRRDRAERPADTLRLMEEARIAARLQHPAITPIYDVGCLPNGQMFLVMPYLAGESLRERLRRGRLETAEAVRICLGVGEAVSYAHRHGFIHRDLQPGNVLLDTQGEPQLADFGLAIRAQSPLCHFAGSLPYMAPEQVAADGRPADPRIDVWALGAILYELLEGEPAFVGSESEVRQAILAGALREPPDGAPQSPPLAAVYRRCLAPDPAARYATAEAVVADLQHWLDAQPPATAPRRGWTRRRMVGWTAAATSLAAVSWVAGNAAWQPDRRGESPAPDLQLLLWNGDGWLPLPARPPRGLRPEDKVRLHVQLPRPAFPYLVWIGADGDVVPLHPWDDGQWHAEGQRPARLRLLQLPTSREEDYWSPRHETCGVETVLLIARDRPWPNAAQALADLMQGLQVPRHDRPVVAWFRQGRPHTPGQLRSAPDPARVSQLASPLIQFQQTLAKRLAPHAGEVLSLVFQTVVD